MRGASALIFFFSSRRRHTRFDCDWSSDVCSSDLTFSANTTGNALGDFLLGSLTESRQSMPSTLSPYQHYAAIYAQDTWRVSPKIGRASCRESVDIQLVVARYQR